MTQFVEQLRNQAKWYAQPGHNARDLMDSRLLEKAADEIECLRAKVEAAEKERDALRAELKEIQYGVAVAHDTIKALRAKIEQMERQEPSHWGCTVLQSDCRWKEEVSREAPPEGYFSVRDIFPLYALPGAQPAPSIPEFCPCCGNIMRACMCCPNEDCNAVTVTAEQAKYNKQHAVARKASGAAEQTPGAKRDAP